MISKRRIAVLILSFVIIGSILRESRAFWGFDELKYFDLGYWGIDISDEVYTLQNVISIWGSLVVIVLLIRRKSPKVQSQLMNHNAPKVKSHRKEGEPPKKGKGREKIRKKNPFEMVNEGWTLVSKNPKAKKKEES